MERSVEEIRREYERARTGQSVEDTRREYERARTVRVENTVTVHIASFEPPFVDVFWFAVKFFIANLILGGIVGIVWLVFLAIS